MRYHVWFFPYREVPPCGRVVSIISVRQQSEHSRTEILTVSFKQPLLQGGDGMKTERSVVSRVGLLLILSTILLYPFAFTATSNAQEMPDVIGIRLNDGSVIEGTH